MSRFFPSIALAAMLPLLAACPSKDAARKDEPPPPPPPPASAGLSPGACASGGGEVKDPVSAGFFPRAAGGFCLDPNGETKTYGDNAKHPKEEVCTTLFDGECEIYMRYKLARVVALRYVDGAGKGATVDVILSSYADVPGAYGMFTKRVIADSDPAEESAPKPFAAGGAAVLGTGRAYVWRGQYIAELQYNNEQESPEQLTKSSGAVLPILAKEIGAKLPGAPDKPASAQALPAAGLVSAQAMEFLAKEPLGLKGIGPAAIGYYKDGGKRYRLVAFAAADADQAKDAMKSLAKRPEALPVSGVADEASAIVIKQGETKIDYLFARKGALVGGVGDDDYAAGQGLSKDEKAAKLKAWLSGAASPGSSGSSAASGSSAPSSSAAPKK
jgi:hypothetical protein